MHSTEKLAEACFAENVNIFGDAQTQPEKHNLYKGLMALSKVLEEVLQSQRRLEQQLNVVVQALRSR